MQNSGKEAGEYLDLVSSYVSRQHSTNFTGSWMLVAYWDRIPPYGSYDRVSVTQFKNNFSNLDYPTPEMIEIV